jgi:hypothetical protein
MTILNEGGEITEKHFGTGYDQEEEGPIYA